MSKRKATPAPPLTVDQILDAIRALSPDDKVAFRRRYETDPTLQPGRRKTLDCKLQPGDHLTPDEKTQNLVKIIGGQLGKLDRTDKAQRARVFQLVSEGKTQPEIAKILKKSISRVQQIIQGKAVRYRR
jgi:hypothetical protein